VRQRGDELGPRGVPAQVATGSAGDRRGDAAGVVRRAEDDDVRLGVRRDQSPRRLHPGRHGTLCADQDDVHRLPGEPGQQLVPVRDAVDPVHSRDRRHHARQAFADAATIVADQYRRHDDSFLQLPAAG
jgi:hypothetical protein